MIFINNTQDSTQLTLFLKKKKEKKSETLDVQRRLSIQTGTKSHLSNFVICKSETSNFVVLKLKSQSHTYISMFKLQSSLFSLIKR